MSTAVRSELVDEMIDLYCDWRTECAEVQAAWDRFLTVPPSDRAGAYAVYVAALDREESACQSYAAQIQLVGGRSS